MRIPVVASLRQGRAIAVLVVLIAAACTTYDIKTAAPMYSDGATVIFYAAPRLANSVGETSFNQSLIVTEAMLAQTMISHVTSPAGMIQIQAQPCNRSDLEYPDYAEQCATLTATSPSVASVHQAFWLAYRALRSRLTNLQASSGVAPRDRIGTYLVGASGPVPQQGSRARVLAGLALLTLIAVVTVWRFFGLHPGWARSRRHRRGGRRRTRRAAGRTVA
jgi:hypothetical protein